MSNVETLRCQCTEDGRTICGKPVGIRVCLALHGKELRRASVYTCLDHAAGMALMMPSYFPHTVYDTIRLIELPGAEAQLEAKQTPQEAHDADR